MADLRTLTEEAGFTRVETYIASGNLVLDSDLAEAEVVASLEAALLAHTGKRVGVLVRTAGEIAKTLAANPYPDAAPNRVLAVFLPTPPSAGWRAAIKGQVDEAIEACGRALFIHYPAGQAATKLVIPAAAEGTARNMNTVAKLAGMSGT